MAGQLNKLPASLEPISSFGINNVPTRVNPVWYQFFQSLASLYSGTSSGPGASALLDTIGSATGGMLARFGTQWNEFVATVPNSIPVMNPGVPVTLRTFNQLLDAIGNAQGNLLFRGAAGWQVLAPVAGRYLRSNGPGADPSLDAGTTGNTVDTGLTATGTTQGTALALAKNWNEITTTVANSGVVLASLGAGQPSLVFNQGANALKVYPPVGGTIDALGVDVPYSLPTSKVQQFSQLTATSWRSLQLG